MKRTLLTTDWFPDMCYRYINLGLTIYQNQSVYAQLTTCIDIETQYMAVVGESTTNKNSQVAELTGYFRVERNQTSLFINNNYYNIQAPESQDLAIFVIIGKIIE